MAVGWTEKLANTQLDVVASTLYAQLHVGDPGAAGTANTSSETTRVVLTLSAASGASRAMAAAIEWPVWSTGITETISHLSFWDAITGGEFQFSSTIGSPQEMSDGKILELLTFSIAHTSLAS
jgi:hypothetical protein